MREVILYAPFEQRWCKENAFAEVEKLQGDVFRAVSSRRTLRVVVDNEPYFVKIHQGIGWREILKNTLSFRLPILGAKNEWQAIQHLKKNGVATMDAVAFGECGTNPAKRHSFLITRALEPTISLEDFCADWLQQVPEPAMKYALIARVAEMARKMHLSGMNHRDFYLCHFLLHLQPAPTAQTLQLSLIDLHRAQIRSFTPRRWRNKDLAGLYFSALEIGLKQRDFLRFLQHYFQQPLARIFKEEAQLLSFLQCESVRLQAKYQRKYAVEHE